MYYKKTMKIIQENEKIESFIVMRFKLNSNITDNVKDMTKLILAISV